jgi:hypothetical protein
MKCGRRTSAFGNGLAVQRFVRQHGNWWSRPGRLKSAILMNSDFKDLLRLFAKHEVRYLVVGGYAAMHYSQPRFTKDLDLWLEPTGPNASRVMRAFREFGLPLIDVTPDDFAQESFQYMIGRAPVLFDFLTSLPQMHFAECWEGRTSDHAESFPIHYLARSDLITAKTIAGRPQDMADLDELRRSAEG